MKTDTKTLIKALRILAEDIESGDGVANACIAEAADRLEEQYKVMQHMQDSIINKPIILGADTKDCTWTRDDEGDCAVIYNTECGKDFILNSGVPVKNGMKYCACCGGKLIEGKT